MILGIIESNWKFLIVTLFLVVNIIFLGFATYHIYETRKDIRLIRSKVIYIENDIVSIKTRISAIEEAKQ
jgi:hypothetical protein